MRESDAANMPLAAGWILPRVSPITAGMFCAETTNPLSALPRASVSTSLTYAETCCNSARYSARSSALLSGIAWKICRRPATADEYGVRTLVYQ